VKRALFLWQSYRTEGEIESIQRVPIEYCESRSRRFLFLAEWSAMHREIFLFWWVDNWLIDKVNIYWHGKRGVRPTRFKFGSLFYQWEKNSLSFGYMGHSLKYGAFIHIFFRRNLIYYPLCTIIYGTHALLWKTI